MARAPRARKATFVARRLLFLTSFSIHRLSFIEAKVRRPATAKGTARAPAPHRLFLPPTDPECAADRRRMGVVVAQRPTCSITPPFNAILLTCTEALPIDLSRTR